MRPERQRLWRWVACAAAACGFAEVLPAAPPAAGFAGTKACAACHTAQAIGEGASAHAAALFRAPDHPLASSFSTGGKLTRSPGYSFEFSTANLSRANDGFRVRISNAIDTMELPVEWAFGAGRQAVTFVTKVDRNWYVEHYPTWYSVPRMWAATPGQEDLRPASLPQAAGRLYSTSDPETGIAGCFECHSTGPVSFGETGEARINEPGVHCEACHGPGAAHVKSPSRKNIRNPQTLSAERLNQFCGTCHRAPPARGEQVDWTNAWNVRHQPIYLNESACFRKSGGALTCLTCHDPHEPAGKKEVAFYNGRCMSCHSASAPRPKAICEKQAPANCIDCHMPYVSPKPPLRFTNHWIGVFGDGAKLKPKRN